MGRLVEIQSFLIYELHVLISTTCNYYYDRTSEKLYNSVCHLEICCLLETKPVSSLILIITMHSQCATLSTKPKYAPVLLHWLIAVMGWFMEVFAYIIG